MHSALSISTHTGVAAVRLGNVRRLKMDKFLFWSVLETDNILENRICKQIQDLHASFWCKRVEEPLKGLKIGSHFQDIA